MLQHFLKQDLLWNSMALAGVKVKVTRNVNHDFIVLDPQNMYM